MHPQTPIRLAFAAASLVGNFLVPRERDRAKPEDLIDGAIRLADLFEERAAATDESKAKLAALREEKVAEMARQREALDLAREKHGDALKLAQEAESKARRAKSEAETAEAKAKAALAELEEVRRSVGVGDVPPEG